MLHGELVRTNGPQARNFIRDCSPSQASQARNFIRDCSPSQASLLFPVWKPSGILEDNEDQFSLVGLHKSPLVPNLGVNFVLP